MKVMGNKPQNFHESDQYHLLEPIGLALISFSSTKELYHISGSSLSSLSGFLFFEQCGDGVITLTLMRWMNLRLIRSMCSTRDNKVVLVNVRPEAA